MSGLSEAIMEYLAAGESALGIVLLAACSALEYVFPPFPGDTVTLFGSFLASQHGWNLPLVFSAVVLGSVLGAGIDYAVGVRLGKKKEGELQGRALKARRKVAPLLARFERHGAAYVALNRFLPGIRALFFIAAGMAGVPFKKVMFWGTVSAALWNALIVAAGFAAGKNWELLLSWLKHYTAAAWAVLGIVLLIAVARFVWMTRNR